MRSYTLTSLIKTLYVLLGYKNHLAIIKCMETRHGGLETLITIWESVLSDETIDKITEAILHTVLYVANELLNQRAMLLSHVSQFFLKSIF